MIYVIKGSESHFIEDKVKQLSKKEGAEVVKFDGSSPDFSIEEMLNACNGNSLFNEFTVVVVKDPYFLIKKVDDSELKPLFNYVAEPLYETDLIFYTIEDKFNARLKAYKQIVDNAQLISLDGLDYKNFNNYCYSRIKEEGLNIDKDTAYNLISICKRNASLFNSNLDVLKLYPDKIDNDAIAKLCTISENNAVFDLINAITDKDISKTISLQRKLIKENDSALGVIALLATSLRQTYYIGYLSSIGYSKYQIMDECKLSEYIINKSFETLRKINNNQILKLLAQLSDLDIACKSDNSISDASRFELFTLNLLKKEN